jgi:hypothetical protein
VRNTIVYIFIFLIASNSSFFQQFYKLPVLIQHFHEHQERGNVNFIDYLAMHYWGEDQKDNDADRDMKLPFKTTCAHSFHMVFVPLNKEISYTLFCPQAVVKSVIAYKPDFYPNPSLSTLFRPPLA